MDLKLRGRTCLMTGVIAGIARVLASEGVKIAMTARRADQLKKLAAEIQESTGVAPVAVVGDITNEEDITRIADSLIDSLGQIDIPVDSSGGSRPLSVGDNNAVWAEAFAFNFTAARRLTEAMLPAMRDQRWGCIINISASMEPCPLNAANAAKATHRLWAKSLSCDVATDGITINCVPPGRNNSEQTLNKLHPTEKARRAFIERNIPAGYFGGPEDIGYQVDFLASPFARYITWAVMPVDGGMHFFTH
jgi:3-oxoacyl-[acyl-carrier protein] reductase